MSRRFRMATILASLLASALFSLPAPAQQQDRHDQRSRRSEQVESDRQRRDDQRRDDQRRDDQRRDDQRRDDQDRRRRDMDRQQRERASQLTLQPQGWVRVAMDYDQDNRIDAVETIYYFDLAQARDRSAQRRGQHRQQQQQMTRSQQQRRQQQRITGEVQDLMTVRFADGQQHRLAKLETQQGRRVPVDLGRVSTIEQLDLQEGDRITVTGKRVRINDRPVICARRIQAGDQTINVPRERDRGLKRVQGEIANLRTTRFRGIEGSVQVARVRLNGGRTETVILGPKDRLSDLELDQGDRIQMLVRRGTLNDRMALIADQVRANEQTVLIRDPQGRQFTSQRARRDSGQQGQRDSGQQDRRQQDRRDSGQQDRRDRSRSSAER